jgi:hypothetical protein
MDRIGMGMPIPSVITTFGGPGLGMPGQFILYW